MRGSSASARVLMVEAHKGQLYLLPARRLRMSERDHGPHHAVALGVTRDETRNTFDEDRLTFGE